jgi:hypothetical protein
VPPGDDGPDEIEDVDDPAGLDTPLRLAGE